MSSSRLILGLVAVIAISSTFLFVRQFGQNPKFFIANNAAQAVTVVAEWRDKARDLGVIESGARLPLIVRDEASMVFRVRYADGREVESKPIYFTSGMTVNVDIAADGVIVKHDFDD